MPKHRIIIEVNKKEFETFLVEHKDGTFSMNSADKNKLFQSFCDEIIQTFIDRKTEINLHAHKDLTTFGRGE